MIEVYSGSQLSNWIKPEDKERLDKQRGFDYPGNYTKAKIKQKIGLILSERTILRCQVANTAKTL